MSCVACDEAQELNEKSLTHLNNATFIRVGNGNVLIAGCQKHLEEFTGRKLVMLREPE